MPEWRHSRHCRCLHEIVLIVGLLLVMKVYSVSLAWENPPPAPPTQGEAGPAGIVIRGEKP